jgi:hypothetical protein
LEQDLADIYRESAVRSRVISHIEGIIASKRNLLTVSSIKEDLQENLSLCLPKYLLRKILMEDMNLRWKRIAHQREYVNKSENIEKRKNFALDLLKIIKSGKVIIKYDESVIGETSSLSYSWERRGSVPGRVLRRSLSGILIMLAVSSDGIRFLQFMDGTNN